MKKQLPFALFFCFLHCTTPQFQTTNTDASQVSEHPRESMPEMPEKTGAMLWKNKEQTFSFAYAWDWQQTTKKQEVTFTNNLGITFTVTKAYIGMLSMEMIPCPEEKKTGYLAPLLKPFLSSIIPTAYANHGSDRDASYSVQFTVSSLFSETPQTFAESTSSGKGYCQIHLLYGPLDKRASDGFALGGKSFFLEGWYQTKQSKTKIPLVLSAYTALGSLLDLPQQTTSKEANTLVVRHFPKSAFADLDPGSLSQVDLGYKVLLGVVRNQQIQYLP